jgi:hypothetical protein
LDDLKTGKNWYSEPHVEQEILMNGEKCIIKGLFRHKQCLRISNNGEPFPDLTCHECKSIPNYMDFQGRVKEKISLTKRGT